MVSLTRYNTCLDLYDFLGVDEVPPPGTVVITSWHHPHRARFVEWFLTRYRPPNKPVALILPCSLKKPYSASRVRRQLYSMISSRNLWSCIHVYTISDLLGLVPCEVEECYPVANYEFPPKALGGFRELLVSIVATELRKVAGSHRRLVAWLPSAHAEIMERASRASGVAVEIRGYGRLAFKSMRELVEYLVEVCRG